MNQAIITSSDNCLQVFRGIENIKEIPLKETIQSIAVSRNGQYIAIGYLNGNIELFNLYNDEIKSQLKGHERRVESLEFSHDSKRLFSLAAHDINICIWDIESSTFLHHIKIPDYYVSSISFSIDDSIVAYSTYIDS